MSPAVDPSPAVVVQHAGGSYPVFIGGGLLERAGRLVTQVTGSTEIVLVTPENLRDSYGERVAASFASRPPIVTVPDGERHKHAGTALRLVGDFVRLGLTRDAIVLIVGGGVAGDTAGFAASIFLRGIPTVQIPTSLLAQVDSSIGGKVGVNLPEGKNLVGAIHPPRCVISDVSVLQTLGPVELRSGVFESLKAGVIGDPQLFEVLDDDPARVLSADREVITEVVRRSVAVKASLVESDERENDRRRLLNYGHTIGHALEAVMGYEGLTHGEAVAWGMIAANTIAVERGLLAPATRDRIENLIMRYEPRRPPPLEVGGVTGALARDKKFRRDRRVMVLPRALGDCVVCEDIGLNEIETAIRAVLP